MPTRVYFLSSFRVTESIIWCSSKCKYFPCQHTIAPYITQGCVLSYVNRGKLSTWQHKWYKQLQLYFHLRLHKWGNEAHHFQSNVKMDSRPHFILLGPLFRLPWCCSDIPYYVDSCYLSALKLYGLPSSSKEITLTMPLPIIVLSLLLLWTFLCFRKIPHQHQCSNTNTHIFVFNKIRESNLFWHFLICGAISSSCQWKTIITTHTKITVFHSMLTLWHQY